MGRLFHCDGIIWMSTEQLKASVLGAPIIFCEVSLQIESFEKYAVFTVFGHIRVHMFK